MNVSSEHSTMIPAQDIFFENSMISHWERLLRLSIYIYLSIYQYIYINPSGWDHFHSHPCPSRDDEILIGRLFQESKLSNYSTLSERERERERGLGGIPTSTKNDQSWVIHKGSRRNLGSGVGPRRRERHPCCLYL